MVMAACPAPAWPQYEEAAPLRRALPVKVVAASATHPQPPLRPPKYHFFGNGTWAASARGNSVKGQQTGANTVRFSHDDAEVSWEMPYLTIRGVLFGERYLKYGGSMRFQDAAHGLTCDVDIDTEGTGFFRSFFRRKKAHAQDAVHGVLRGKDGEELDVLTGSWLSHLEWEKGVSVDKGEGGWEKGVSPRHPCGRAGEGVEGCMPRVAYPPIAREAAARPDPRRPGPTRQVCNGKLHTVWDAVKTPVDRAIAEREALPSDCRCATVPSCFCFSFGRGGAWLCTDLPACVEHARPPLSRLIFQVQSDSHQTPHPRTCRFRNDLVQLKTGTLDAAQRAKVELEQLQRADRRLRSEGLKRASA